MFSQTLGTALGDCLADTSGLGYAGGAAVFGAALVLVAALYFLTAMSRTLLFAVAIIALVLILPQRAGRHPGAAASAA